MPLARPNGDELLDAVAEFLRHIAETELTGQAAFHARVAANAITVVGRERDLLDQMNAAELKSLVEILGAKAETTDLACLNKELANRIAENDGTLDQQKTLDHLRRTVRHKLRLSNPKYLLAEDR